MWISNQIHEASKLITIGTYLGVIFEEANTEPIGCLVRMEHKDNSKAAKDKKSAGKDKQLSCL